MSMGDVEFNENELVSRAAQGDSDAYAVLVRQYQNRLFAAMLAMVNSREDAEDLTQEALAMGFAKLSSFEGRSSFFTWLHRVACNLAFSHRRKHRKEKSMHRQSMEAAEADLQDDRETVEAELDRNRRQAIIRDGIQRLDEEYRAVLVLRDLQGLGYSEIADALEIPIGTVRSRLHRARLELKDILAMLLGSELESESR